MAKEIKKPLIEKVKEDKDSLLELEQLVLNTVPSNIQKAFLLLIEEVKTLKNK